MTLKEWNNLIMYTKGIVCDLRDHGANVEFRTYGSELGKKGIVLQVFDVLGNLYNEYHSGIDTYAREVCAIGYYANKIKEEL